MDKRFHPTLPKESDLVITNIYRGMTLTAIAAIYL